MTADPQMAASTSDLLGLITPQRLDSGLFVCASPKLVGRPNAYGGQLLAQTLLCAAESVAHGRFPHSIHASFVGEGRFEADIIFRVTVVRDGRSFSVRSVTAEQSGRIVLTATVSFQLDEPGYSYPLTPPPLRRPAPSTGDVPATPFAPWAWGFDWVDATTEEDRTRDCNGWSRARVDLGPDRAMHAAVLAYMSDHYGETLSSAVREQPAPAKIQLVTLDHAMWFHRPARADDWVHYEVGPVVAGGGRGLLRGTVRDTAGRVVASYGQELLIRPPRGEQAASPGT